MKRKISIVTLLIFLMSIFLPTALASEEDYIYKGIPYTVYTYRYGDDIRTLNSLEEYFRPNMKPWYDEYFGSIEETMKRLKKANIDDAYSSMFPNCYPKTEIIAVNGKPWQQDPDFREGVNKALQFWYEDGVPKNTKVFPEAPEAGKKRVYIYLGLKAGSILSTESAEGIMLDTAPFLNDNTTMIPLRGVVDRLGAELKWNPDTQEVSVKANGNSIVLKKNSTVAIVNGKEVILAKPMIIKNNRTLIPVRFVSENLGYDVGWTGELGGNKIYRVSITN